MTLNLFEREHQRIDALLHAHLLDVVGGDFKGARRRLARWRQALNGHIQIEQTRLLPHVPAGARWDARVYQLEHDRIALLADEYAARVQAAAARPPQGRQARRQAVLDLLDAVLATAVFDVDLLADRAGQGGTTATALADGLVQQFGLPFRLAHQVVSSLVTDGSGFTGARVSERATALAGRPIVASDAWVAERLDPWVFVNERTGLGGPAPSAVETAIATARDRLTGDRAAVDAFAGRIARAADRRAGQAEALVQRVGAGMPGRESVGS